MLDKIESKLRKMLAKLMVRSARKEQPSGYITLFYSPNYNLEMDKLNSSETAPHWIQDVRDGRESVKPRWNKSGHFLIAVALRADDLAAEPRAIQLLSFYLQGTSLWRWKMAFFPIELP